MTVKKFPSVVKMAPTVYETETCLASWRRRAKKREKRKRSHRKYSQSYTNRVVQARGELFHNFDKQLATIYVIKVETVRLTKNAYFACQSVINPTTVCKKKWKNNFTLVQQKKERTHMATFLSYFHW